MKKEIRMGKSFAPDYETAAGAEAAVSKRAYFAKMRKLFDAFQAEHPFCGVQFRTSDGVLYGILKERAPGDFELERRMQRMMRKIQRDRWREDFGLKKSH
jgi:hypothetical protein